MTATPLDQVRFDTYPLAFGAEAVPAHVREVATVAEELRYSGLRFPDHVALPRDIPDKYPFSETGEYPYDHTDPIHDVFGVLSFVAGATDDISLMSNICVVPFRHPVVLAKQALTLDALSDGRFEFGVGLGWLRTEFEVLDVPYAERGSRTDEFLDMFEAVCADGAVAFDGPHHSFQETGFYPRPVAEGGPPVWVGGVSGAAFRRLARNGDGWIAPGSATFEDITAALERIEAAWDDYDRDGEPKVSVSLPLYESSRDGLRDAGDILEDVRAYAEAGVTNMNLFFRPTDHQRQLRQMRTVADDVIAACR